MNSFKASYAEKKFLFRYYLLKFSPAFLRPLILFFKYKKFYNSNLNLINPKKLSEKIQWMKLFEKNKLKSSLTDKIYVKDYVKQKTPDLKVAEIYKVFDKNIDYESLPDSFVLKTNHSWKTNIFVRDKNSLSPTTKEQYSKYYEKVLKIDYAFWSYYEMQYCGIDKKVFAESLITSSNNNSKIEYEVYCINGNVEFVQVLFPIYEDDAINTAARIYDKNKKELDFYIKTWAFENEQVDISNFSDVVKYATILSKDFNFVRIDFLDIDNQLYFLEFTFTPHSGFIAFSNPEYDIKYGNLLNL